MKTEFVEVVEVDGKRYISYLCPNCNDWHTVRYASISRLRTMKKNAKEFILWCGKGIEPQFEDGIGILIRIVPRERTDKKKMRTLENRLREIKFQIRHGASIENELITNVFDLVAKHNKDISTKVQELENARTENEKLQTRLKELVV